ncbi:MAG TPA: YggS family pyridoxal phosphate-dependent enzyme [Thermoanaerobaculia bacterium]|nr:YggS family pyridoxal phosphate-dependent enzyme [Thermoanaerobaculia bacterium]
MSGPSGADPAGLSRRVREVRERIARACETGKRDPSGVTLVAVTKTHPVDTVRRAAETGLTVFGENRVQEGVAKIEALRPDFPGLSWRLIGRLQSNKAKTAVRYFEEIQSVDRSSLLEILSREAGASGRRLPIYVEVNVGGEASKGGVDPGGAAALVGSALAAPAIELRGLMTVPPFSDDPAASRPFFRQLRSLRDRLQDETGSPIPGLSMGMSHDFEVAIEEGATVVRVGTALFGARESA